MTILTPMCECDVCGEPSRAGDLVRLHEDYRVDDIEWICKQCNADLNEVLEGVDAIIAKIMKRTRKSAVSRGISAIQGAFAALSEKVGKS